VSGVGHSRSENDFPFLRLSREFDGLDEVVDGLLSDCGAFGGDEVFCRVHIFAFRSEGAVLLSSPPPRESRTAPNETHPPVLAPPGGGASAN